MVSASSLLCQLFVRIIVTIEHAAELERAKLRPLAAGRWPLQVLLLVVVGEILSCCGTLVAQCGGRRCCAWRCGHPPQPAAYGVH